MAAIRVLIVDDHVLFADAIRPILERLGFDQVQHVTSGADAIQAAHSNPPDLALVDLGLPDRSGLAVGQEMFEKELAGKVVILTALNDTRTAELAMRTRLHGYLTKDEPVARFADSLQAILRGRAVFPNGSRIGRVRDSTQRDAHLLAEHLTAREREVLGLLVQGVRGEIIAGELGISSNTVRTHVQSILTKLQVHSRLEAATFAVRYGVVDTPMVG